MGEIIVRLLKIWNLIGQCKSPGNVRLVGNTNIRWYSNTKTDKYILSFLSLWGRWLSSHLQKFLKIGVLEIFVKLIGNYLCRSLSLITLRHVAFLKIETPTQLLLFEFREVLKNINFTRLLHTAASVFWNVL